MTVIRIQERSEQDGIFQATVSFNQEPEYAVTVRDPFSKEEEERLAWYFEEHLKFPFTDQVKAQEATASITKYGESLFTQVFAPNSQILSKYKVVAQVGLNTSQIEIIGQPSFHALHWEALKDPDLSEPLALQATIVRKNGVSQAISSTVRSSPTINLLIVTARPRGRRDIGYRTVSRPLVEALLRDRLPVKIDILRPGTYKALEHHLHATTEEYGAGYYHVVHFDVHGSLLSYQDFRIMSRFTRNQHRNRQDIQPYEGVKGFLALEGEQEGIADLVAAEELATLLVQHQIPIAILNACQSGKQVGARETSLGSYLMRAGVQMVLAMGYSITVSAAAILMSTLYRELFAGHDLHVAIRQARQKLASRKGRRVAFNQEIDLEDWLLPVVYQNQPLHLHPRLFTPGEEAEFFQRQVRQYRPAEPLYSFVGRDLDILQIEKRLLTKGNILLIRGMGGAGKTTLLKHLGAWWQTTGFVDQVCYFGYDERAWTRQQLIVTIAKQIYGEETYLRDYQSLSLDEQQVQITEYLRAHRYLLLLDNLESITDAHLATRLILTLEEKLALHRLLTDLCRCKTIILFGSRSGEDWLAKGTFGDNLYDLPGLDPEAASTLADRILEQHGATKYRQDDKLRDLIRLLDGFPLALEVVLSNLARQTPTEVLAALQSGDVNFNAGTSQEKTENILRCIEYSYSKLSLAAQRLLLCLAPFTSVIYQNLIEQYANKLKQQSLLANFPFEQWSEVIQEAQNWGLLSPDLNIPAYVHFHPILPYFLRLCLNTPEQEETRVAIENAFLEHYSQLSRGLVELLGSKEPKEQQSGLVLTRLEYENLTTALELALDAQYSIYSLYFALSRYLTLTRNHYRGLELDERVLKRLERYSLATPDIRLAVEFLTGEITIGIAGRQKDLKQYELAEISYKKALAVFLGWISDDLELRNKICAGIYYDLGAVLRERGEWEQAGEYFQQALQIYIDYNDQKEQADIYQQLGTIAEQRQEWEQAEHYLRQALQINIAYNDLQDQATVYNSLGVSALRRQELKQAEHYFQQALRIFIAYNDFQYQALTYHNLSGVALAQNEWKQAERYCQQGLQIAIADNDYHTQAMIYTDLGSIELGQMELEQAEHYFHLALPIFIDYKDRHGQAVIYQQLGELAKKQQRWVESRDYLLRALEMSTGFEDDISASAWRGLAHIWQASGDASLPAAVANVLGTSVEETEKLLREMLGSKPGEAALSMLEALGEQKGPQAALVRRRLSQTRSAEKISSAAGCGCMVGIGLLLLGLILFGLTFIFLTRLPVIREVALIMLAAAAVVSIVSFIIRTIFYTIALAHD